METIKIIITYLLRIEVGLVGIAAVLVYVKSGKYLGHRPVIVGLLIFIAAGVALLFLTTALFLFGIRWDDPWPVMIINAIASLPLVFGMALLGLVVYENVKRSNSQKSAHPPSSVAVP